MLLGEKRREKKAVAQRVDPARNAAGQRVDQIEALGLEVRIVLPVDMVQPVLDVAARLGLVERAQVIRGDHTLPQLLHLRAAHHLPQFRLTDQEALQQRLVAELEVREHAQLLDRARGEVLRFVDHEQRAFLFHCALAEEGLQRREQHGLVERLHRQPERHGDRAQHVLGVELRADELRCDDLRWIELLEQAAHDRRLAGADIAGDDDEPFALVQTVLEIGEGALVAAAAEVERRIGIELERLAGQPEKGFVHRRGYLSV